MNYYLIIILAFFVSIRSYAKELILTSPGGNIKVLINDQEGISFNVLYNSQYIFSASDISLILKDPPQKELAAHIKKFRKFSVSGEISPVISEKFKSITDHYNEMEINLSNGYIFIIRAYNNGVAYRFRTRLNEQVTVRRENLKLHFSAGDSAWFQQSPTFRSPYEGPYHHSSVSDMPEHKMFSLPVYIHKNNGIKIILLESDLTDYPGLWFSRGEGITLNADFAPHPALNATLAGKDKSINGEEKLIAITNGNRNYPWRIFAIAENDAQLLTNQLVYILADTCRIKDTQWIKPGKVILDWWAKRNIYDIDFKAGINTETAKYFIDFASESGIEYFLFDYGWTNNDNILDINPDLDMNSIVRYAEEKNVMLLVWLYWSAFEKQMPEVFDMLEKWNIKGIKVDFMNRDDQEMVNFYHKAAEETARRKMIIDFHGAYKPAGLRRMYPNVLTREALLAYEYNGWTEFDSPAHHNILPYVRMVAGPMDYIPGTFNNASKKYFKPVDDFPMSQGTRAHSIALMVIFESPLQMIPDAPSDYMKEKECFDFLSTIPVEWDTTVVLGAKLGEYTALARKHDDMWYIGSITNWDPRDITINLDFLDEGIYLMEYMEDGKNADNRAIDFQKKYMEVTRNNTINVHMASGGGWVSRLIRLRD